MDYNSRESWVLSFFLSYFLSVCSFWPIGTSFSLVSKDCGTCFRPWLTLWRFFTTLSCWFLDSHGSFSDSIGSEATFLSNRILVWIFNNSIYKPSTGGKGLPWRSEEKWKEQENYTRHSKTFPPKHTLARSIPSQTQCFNKILFPSARCGVSDWGNIARISTITAGRGTAKPCPRDRESDIVILAPSCTVLPVMTPASYVAWPDLGRIAAPRCVALLISPCAVTADLRCLASLAVPSPSATAVYIPPNTHVADRPEKVQLETKVDSCAERCAARFSCHLAADTGVRGCAINGLVERQPSCSLIARADIELE